MWWFVLFALATAHVPVFDDDLLERDIVGKSWGVYRTLAANESMLLRLNVAAGEELSFSVNLLGSAPFVEGKEYVTVTMYGHNTTDIVCEPDYTGWRRRLDAGLDQLRTFTTDTTDHGFHYEPFGVGLCRSLVACRGDAIVGDIFNLTITAVEDVPVSVGVGMAESFGFHDFLVMSFSLRRTWALDAWSDWWFLFSLTVVAVTLTVLHWNTLPPFENNPQVDDLELELMLVRAVLLFSAAQFASRLLQVTMYGGPIVGSMLSITVIVHVIIPLALFASLRCLYTLEWQSAYVPVPVDDTSKTYAQEQVVPIGIAYTIVMPLVLCLYSFLALWQGYHIILLVLLITRTRSYVFDTYGV